MPNDSDCGIPLTTHSANLTALPSPRGSDSDRAEYYRKALADAVAPLLILYTESKREGFEIGWSMMEDGFGSFHVASLVVKKLL